VLETGDRRVGGIEVKAARSATASWFHGLRHLRDKLGDRFVLGVVTYTGPDVIPFGDRLCAMPLAALWTG